MKKNYKSNAWYLKHIGNESGELSKILKDNLIWNKDTKEYDVNLRQFASQVPTEKMNEFLTSMINKIVVQKVFDITAGANFPYLDFQEADTEYGDTIELIAVDNLDYKGNDYSNKVDLDAKVPTVNTQYIYTTDKKFWKISVLPAVIKRAIVREGQLGALIGVILGRLDYAYKKYLYVNISADLSKVVSKTITLPSLGVNTTEADAKKYLSTVFQLGRKMAEFSTDFNEEGMESITPLGTATLYINSATAAALNVEAYASLLNSDKLETKKVFNDIRTVQFYKEDGSVDTDTVGYILDNRFYKYYVPIKESTSWYCPSSLITTYWLHAWIKRGYAPFVNAIKLVKENGTLDGKVE